MRGDDDILSAGHGGYSVDSRFESRWTNAPAPEGVTVPTAEDAAATHPYLKRIRSRGWPVWQSWAIRVARGPHSTETPVRLVYVYVNEDRDQHEAVIIDDPEQFARWVAVTLRRG